jgi:hypothetical protein
MTFLGTNSVCRELQVLRWSGYRNKSGMSSEGKERSLALFLLMMKSTGKGFYKRAIPVLSRDSPGT